jgi:nicotinamide mononucleotide (NMN) deamidase PncC
MRSEAIFRAKEMIGNKYQLCQTVSKTTRMLHIANRNTQETITNAFSTIAGSKDSKEKPAGAKVA